MRALVWDGTAARVVDRPQPTPTPGMAVVRVALAGICNTDLELVKGYMDFRGVLGHEFIGTVEDGPAEWRRQAGRRRDQLRLRALSQCAGADCRATARRDASWAFSTPMVPSPSTSPCRSRNLHAVPDGVDDDAAVFTEPLAAAFEILEQVRVEPGTECVVLGDGKLGLLVAQVLFQAGARVLAVGQARRQAAHPAARGIATVTLARLGSSIGGRRRRGHGYCRRLRRGNRGNAPARHVGTEEHGRGRRRSQSGAGGDQRDHGRRLALRPLRARRCGRSKRAVSTSGR